MAGSDPGIFDDVATDYDEAFTNTPLGRILRRRVWRRLEDNFEAGQQVLELACGTGEDAVWLAGRGVDVIATDGSAEMIRVAREKARQSGLGVRIEFLKLSLQNLIAGETPFETGQFDGVFSNFGGVNTIGEWSALAGALARLLRPGGRLILVPMGPTCPWEIAWHMVHGQAETALRRLSGKALARVGKRSIPVWYPSLNRLQNDFSPWFKTLGYESLGLWLPPSYLGSWLAQRPGLMVGLSGLDAATARYGAGWGDHYLIIFERLA